MAKREAGTLGSFLGDLWDVVKDMKVAEVVEEVRENGRLNSMAKLALRRARGAPIDVEVEEVKPAEGSEEEKRKP